MNVPKLRFKEFSGEWEEKSFRDIVSLNLVPVEKPSADYVRLGIRSHGKGTFHELVKIENLLEADKMFLVPKDNLILNITFAWEHAIAITSENDEGKYVSGRFPTFAFKKNEVPAFYESIIRSKRMKYELGVASPGGAGRNRVLNKELFLDIPVKTTGFEEQTRIAEFVKCIDKKIENQKLVAESLENQKKGLMQKIFSQELRFKDDDGKEFPAWEEKKLGEVFNITAGGDIDKAHVSKTKNGTFVYPVYANALTNSGVYGYSDVYKIEDDAITVTGRGDIGVAKARTGKFYPIVRLLVLVPKEKMDIIFFENLINYTKKYDESTGVSQLTVPQLAKIKVKIPSFEEQFKIGALFGSLDAKIEKEKVVLDHWQQIKKGLLQQMFV